MRDPPVGAVERQYQPVSILFGQPQKPAIGGYTSAVESRFEGERFGLHRRWSASAVGALGGLCSVPNLYAAEQDTYPCRASDREMDRESGPAERAMRDAGYGLRRTSLPRTPMHKGSRRIALLACSCYFGITVRAETYAGNDENFLPCPPNS
jgi:hypothetical protein